MHKTHDFKPVMIQASALEGWLRRIVLGWTIDLVRQQAGLIQAVLISALLTLTLLPVASHAGEVTLVGSLRPDFAFYTDVWGEGDYAYLGTGGLSGVYIIDVSNPSDPVVAGHYTQGAVYLDVKVFDGIGYFANDGFGDGVHIVDVSDASDPSLLSVLEIGNVHNLSVAGTVMYTTDGFGRTVKVFDVSEPTDPQWIRDIVTPVGDSVHDITAIGDRLYTSSFNGRTRIYDVSAIDTRPEVEIGAILSGASSHSNWVTDDGQTLVSARERNNGDITLFDISDPANPEFLDFARTNQLGLNSTSPHNPLIVDDFLYVSWYGAGLQIFDISDPANIVHVGQYDTSPFGADGFIGNWGVYPFLGPDRILLSDTHGGLFIVDATAVVPEPHSCLMFIAVAILILFFPRK